MAAPQDSAGSIDLSSSRRKRGAVTALFAGAIGIGFAPILVRLSEVGPSATAAFRILFALPILWLLVAIERNRNPQVAQPSGWPDYKALAVAGLFFTGDLSLWHWSLQITTVANSTLLTNFAPLFVTIGAYVLFREKVSRQFVAGLLVALAGAAVLVAQSVTFSAQQMWGDLLAVVTASVYSGYLLSVKGLRRRFSTLTIMAWTGLVSCPALFVVALCSGEKLLPIDLAGWKVLVALALISHVGGQTLIAYAFGHLPASFSSVTLLLQPVIAALLAAAMLGEKLTTVQVIGGIVTLVGIILASRAGAGSMAANNKS